MGKHLILAVALGAIGSIVFAVGSYMGLWNQGTGQEQEHWEVEYIYVDSDAAAL